MKNEKTVKMFGVEIKVHFFYSPAEEEVRYYNDGSGYPGCAESYEIHGLFIEETDVFELLQEIPNFERKLIEELKKE